MPAVRHPVPVIVRLPGGATSLQMQLLLTCDTLSASVGLDDVVEYFPQHVEFRDAMRRPSSSAVHMHILVS